MEIVRRLDPRGLISSADVDAAVSAWAQRQAEKRNTSYTTGIQNVVSRLILELIIPRMDPNSLGYLEEPWFKEGTQERGLYLEIAGIVSGKDRGSLYRSAKAISKELIRRAWRQMKQTSLDKYKVPGDLELTDPRRGVAGIRGGTSPFVWEPEAHPRGLGYVQSRPKDD